jgi:hypothetical protein
VSIVDHLVASEITGLDDAIAFAKPFDSAVDAWWRQCPHADAMIIMLHRLKAAPWFIVDAAAACAALATPLAPRSLQSDAAALISAMRLFSAGKLHGERLIKRFDGLQTRVRATPGMTESAVCAVSAIVITQNFSHMTPRLVADSFALALTPEFASGAYDEASYKKTYDDALEQCAHAIRDAVGDIELSA